MHFLCAETKEKKWVFADMPHYIKLLRNHFLDSGLLLNDGTVLNSDLLIELLKMDCGEVRLCYKLKPQFLFVTGNARQKVGPAKAVFSRTVSKAILKLLKNEKAAHFFELIDSFFDIMNSKCPNSNSSQPMNSAFGFNPQIFEKQKQVLSEVSSTIRSMRVVGKKIFFHFKKGSLYQYSHCSDCMRNKQNLV